MYAVWQRPPGSRRQELVAVLQTFAPIEESEVERFLHQFDEAPQPSDHVFTRT